MVDANDNFHDAGFMPVDLDVQTRADGTMLIRSRVPLPEHNANLPRVLAATFARKGDAPALAWRDAGGAWRKRSYRELGGDVDASASWLQLNAPARSAVMILAENGLPAAVMTLAAHAAGMIAAPVGPAHALAGEPFERLRHVIARQCPAVALIESRPQFAAAAKLLRESGAAIVAVEPESVGGGVSFGTVISTPRAVDLDAAVAALDVDLPAQYMLTSGSTGLPKVVPQTLRMLSAYLVQGAMAAGSAAGWAEDMLDWLPWHHAAGAAVVRTCLAHGGTFHIDGGKPLPGLFDESLRNLREISVSSFANVPAGYAMLADALEVDPELRRRFFANLRLMIYGGAGLPQSIYDRLQALAMRETGHRVHITTAYGLTETVAAVMTVHWADTRVGIGLPAPGVMLKLVPVGSRYEVRFAGPSIMSGYLDEAAKTREAFDEEGFFRTGDLATFHVADDPSQGLVFAGRQVEEFKLLNGTWVEGGMLRDRLLRALGGLVRELVLADDARPCLGMLAWAEPGVSLDEVATAVGRFNASQRGASSRIARLALFDTPPSPAHHELSEKGSVNRRAVLDRRRDLVARLFAENPDEAVRVLA